MLINFNLGVGYSDKLTVPSPAVILSPNPKDGGHIVFDADPVGVGVCFHFRALSSEPVDGV